MPLSVLIIDDSNIDRLLTEKVIQGDMFAAEVVSCGSVREGLTHLLSRSSAFEKMPDVILLDVNMPMLDGFDFLDSFMKFPEEMQRQSAIFMLSATNSQAELERIARYPIVRRFFNKPLTSDILNDIRAEMEK